MECLEAGHQEKKPTRKKNVVGDLLDDYRVEACLEAGPPGGEKRSRKKNVVEGLLDDFRVVASLEAEPPGGGEETAS